MTFFTVGTPVYPRPCGGALTSPRPSQVGHGLSPPVRGSRERHGRANGPPGSIPARAGEPPPCCPGIRSTGVYPRPCGGAAESVLPYRCSGGLSPPVRGSRLRDVRRLAEQRSIPARAGEPPLRARGMISVGVYPRPCGGAVGYFSIHSPSKGLSPPVRGSHYDVIIGEHTMGSIPARAGEPGTCRPSSCSTGVYPRPCGGAVMAISVCSSPNGLSPPVRGSRKITQDGKKVRGSIPARAGEPEPWQAIVLYDAVYPRPCGGADGKFRRYVTEAGLSPPVRGSLDVLFYRRGPGRSIPARAGEPLATPA